MKQHPGVSDVHLSHPNTGPISKLGWTQYAFVILTVAFVVLFVGAVIWLR